MGLDGWITIGVIALMLVGLVQERLTPDTLVLGAVALLAVLGVLEPREVIGGFASQSVLAVAALYVIAGAMRSTGALQDLSQRVLGPARNERSAVSRLGGFTTVSSAFLNNTPIVAMLLPATLGWAKQHAISPSKLLIPLSYAAIAGGVCTLIGTSTNLLVHDLLLQRGLPGFGMFELSFVGVPCAAVALLYLVTICPRLIPDRVGARISAEQTEREYLVEMRLESASPLVGNRFSI